MECYCLGESTFLKLSVFLSRISLGWFFWEFKPYGRNDQLVAEG